MLYLILNPMLNGDHVLYKFSAKISITYRTNIEIGTSDNRKFECLVHM